MKSDKRGWGCRFFSSLIQRAAKLAKRKGGGSLSLLLVGAGVPARGEAPRPPPTAQYKHLSEQQCAKLKVALEAAQQDARLSQPEGCLRTEVCSVFSCVMGKSSPVNHSFCRDVILPVCCSCSSVLPLGHGALPPLSLSLILF